MILDPTNIDQPSRGNCKYCKQENVILLQAVNWEDEACWECIKNGKSKNPTELGWSP